MHARIALLITPRRWLRGKIFWCCVSRDRPLAVDLDPDDFTDHSLGGRDVNSTNKFESNVMMLEGVESIGARLTDCEVRRLL